METKQCQNCKNDFVIDSEDRSFYEKIKVPAPTFCAECRMIRRFAFRNQNKLFKAKDHFTGEPVFSLVPPDSGAPVVTNEEWYSDSWDGLEYGVDVDFSRPFLEQLRELVKKVPQINLNVTRVINSPYSGNANDLKNCYLVFNAANNEDCMYGVGNYDSKQCLDNNDIYTSEFCYGNFWIEKSNRVRFSEECGDCVDVWFLKNCVGCVSCIGCVNLRNKSYCIFNEQYDKESYKKEVEKMRLDTFLGCKEVQEKARAFWKKFPKKYYQGIKNVNSTGVYVTQSKNVKDSFLVFGGEDLRYVQYVSQPPNKNSYDVSVWGDGIELAYEYSSSGSGIYNSKFLVDCWPNIRDTEYSMHCNSVHNVFGCAGLKNKEYCILNKQYSKEEYEILVEKIKKHMTDMPYTDAQGLVYTYGEFFPIEFSWYGYNNTMAQEFFPISKETATQKGYPWYEVKRGEYRIDIDAKDLPQAIGDVPDTIIEKVIGCEVCALPFRFQQEEILFLKREQIPLPHKCPDCRYKERVSRRVAPKLYKRSCMNTGCHNEFLTGYNPSDGDIVYCESCYQQEVA